MSSLSCISVNLTESFRFPGSILPIRSFPTYQELHKSLVSQNVAGLDCDVFSTRPCIRLGFIRQSRSPEPLMYSLNYLNWPWGARVHQRGDGGEEEEQGGRGRKWIMVSGW